MKLLLLLFADKLVDNIYQLSETCVYRLTHEIRVFNALQQSEIIEARRSGSQSVDEAAGCCAECVSTRLTLQKNDGAERSAEQEVGERQRSGEQRLQK